MYTDICIHIYIHIYIDTHIYTYIYRYTHIYIIYLLYLYVCIAAQLVKGPSTRYIYPKGEGGGQKHTSIVSMTSFYCLKVYNVGQCVCVCGGGGGAENY